MRYIIILLLLSVFGNAQTQEIFTVAEEMPEFPGGGAAMIKYIDKAVKTNYPTSAKEAGITGKCFLKFIVNSDGSISDVIILKGMSGCPECDTVALNIIKNMPKWKPGKQNGKPVAVYFNQQVRFN